MLPPIASHRSINSVNEKQFSQDIQKIREQRQMEQAEKMVLKYKKDQSLMAVLDLTIEQVSEMQRLKMIDKTLPKTLKRYREVI